jgi:uncharacterized protein YcbX
MYIQEIWRYPVKSMAGESLTKVAITKNGLDGDRVVHVRNGEGHVITARTHPGLLLHHATLDAKDAPLVDGRPWTDASVLADVRQIAGRNAKLVRDETLDRFDILPLLVATDGAIEAFGRDGRRLRPNSVIGGVKGLEERKWPGHRLRIGKAIVTIDSLRGRCIMTTFDPDTIDHDPNVLNDIVRRFGGKLALNCDVEHGGLIQVGDAVELLDSGTTG